MITRSLHAAMSKEGKAYRRMGVSAYGRNGVSACRRRVGQGLRDRMGLMALIRPAI